MRVKVVVVVLVVVVVVVVVNNRSGGGGRSITRHLFCSYLRLAIMVNGKFQCIGSVQHIKSRFVHLVPILWPAIFIFLLCLLSLLACFLAFWLSFVYFPSLSFSFALTAFFFFFFFLFSPFLDNFVLDSARGISLWPKLSHFRLANLVILLL